MTTTEVPPEQPCDQNYHWDSVGMRMPDLLQSSRRKLPGTGEAIDALLALAKDNPDKALVMRYIGQLVADGFAVWEMLDGGEIEICFTSGEIYLLAETTILRLT